MQSDIQVVQPKQSLHVDEPDEKPRCHHKVALGTRGVHYMIHSACQGKTPATWNEMVGQAQGHLCPGQCFGQDSKRQDKPQ